MNFAARRHHRQPAACVLELAHVPGPVECLEAARHLGLQRLGLDRDLVRGPLEIVREQQRDVVAAFPQRGRVHPDDVEAMEEVLPECPVANPRFEVLMRRRDDPHVDVNRHMAPDAIELAIGEHPEQARLEIGRHVSDLVEEQRAAVGLLETAETSGLGAGEGAALVTEQLRFE